MSQGFRYLKSAHEMEDFPPEDLPEVVVLGRSNCGKSTLLNLLMGHKLVNVSSTPGKTTLLSFFEKKSEFRYVDVPGYGFAARARPMVASWKKSIEAYLTVRRNLKGAILLVDIRRPWTEDEQKLADFLDAYDVPWIVALTKKDQLPKSQLFNKTKEFAVLGRPFWMVSSHKRDGIKELQEFIECSWLKSEKHGKL